MAEGDGTADRTLAHRMSPRCSPGLPSPKGSPVWIPIRHSHMEFGRVLASGRVKDPALGKTRKKVLHLSRPLLLLGGSRRTLQPSLRFHTVSKDVFHKAEAWVSLLQDGAMAWAASHHHE